MIDFAKSHPKAQPTVLCIISSNCDIPLLKIFWSTSIQNEQIIPISNIFQKLMRGCNSFSKNPKGMNKATLRTISHTLTPFICSNTATYVQKGINSHLALVICERKITVELTTTNKYSAKRIHRTKLFLIFMTSKHVPTIIATNVSVNDG